MTNYCTFIIQNLIDRIKIPLVKFYKIPHTTIPTLFLPRLMFSGDRKLASHYHENPIFKKFIQSLSTDTLNISSHIYNGTHLCCCSCTCKIMCHYKHTQPFFSLYKILNSGLDELHFHDLNYDIYTGTDSMSDIRFDKDVFWALYDFTDVFFEYVKLLTVDEMFEIFQREIQQRTVGVLRENASKLEGRFEDIVRAMENRKVHEHVLFCEFLEWYVDGEERCVYDVRCVLEYCIGNMGVREVSVVYEKVRYLE